MAKAKVLKQPVAGETYFFDWEIWVLHSTLQTTDWNISHVSRCLGVGRSTLHRKIKLFKLKA
jgi:transcriptional regulator of acetoin/glycerol metabolism